MNDTIKGLIIGLILGLIISCNENIMADGEGSGYGEIGTTEYNPLYVRIVEWDCNIINAVIVEKLIIT